MITAVAECRNQPSVSKLCKEVCVGYNTWEVEVNITLLHSHVPRPPFNPLRGKGSGEYGTTVLYLHRNFGGTI